MTLLIAMRIVSFARNANGLNRQALAAVAQSHGIGMKWRERLAAYGNWFRGDVMESAAPAGLRTSGTVHKLAQFRQIERLAQIGHRSAVA